MTGPAPVPDPPGQPAWSAPERRRRRQTPARQNCQFRATPIAAGGRTIRTHNEPSSCAHRTRSVTVRGQLVQPVLSARSCCFPVLGGWVGVLPDARLDVVARVDPDDDNLRRHIVWHYRYDPERHERRHVVVAAFDSRREFNACLQAVSEEIERRKAAGEPVDPREHVSGTLHEPGSGRRAANGRLVMRALRHGVAPGPWMDELEMPSNMAVFGASAGPVHRPHGRRGRLIRGWLASRRYRRASLLP